MSVKLKLKRMLEDIQALKDGWCDGDGVLPDHDGVNWLKWKFQRDYPADGQMVYFFPTIDGKVLVHCIRHVGDKKLKYTVALEVDLEKKEGNFSLTCVDPRGESMLESETDVAFAINLKSRENWCYLFQFMSGMTISTRLFKEAQDFSS